MLPPPETPNPINAAQKRLQREEDARGSRTLVEESFAANRTTEAGDAVIAVPFSFKFVIVRELLVCRIRQYAFEPQDQEPHVPLSMSLSA